MNKKEMEICNRKERLKAAGATYADLARLAGVTWTMAWMWMNGQRTSGRMASAFEKLTGPRTA